VCLGSCSITRHRLHHGLALVFHLIYDRKVAPHAWITTYDLGSRAVQTGALSRAVVEGRLGLCEAAAEHNWIDKDGTAAGDRQGQSDECLGAGRCIRDDLRLHSD
jgi:hypothetical protein